MKKTLFVISLIVVVLLVLLSYEGIWATAKIEKAKEGGYVMMGIDHKGAYYKIGDTMKKLQDEVKAAGIENPKFAGIYYDNPDEVAEDSLRSFAAVIISNPADSAKLMAMKNYKVVEVEKGNALICDMHTPDMISTIIAVYKAYPAFSEYFASNPDEAKTIKYTYELYKEGTTRFVFQYQ
jgi:hypothetical protein